MTHFLRLSLIVILIHAAAQSASALIRGGAGKEPLHDPGWPTGAAAVFNHPGRVAWWKGPPFGGGQWHAECRGDSQTFNQVLADLAKIDAKVKRVVLHDGVGASFLLNPNHQPDKREAARTDWSFSVWQPGSWTWHQSRPAALRQPQLGDPHLGPPVQLDVYTGGDIHWKDIVVPPGIEIDDQRLEAHGLSLDDGMVFEGIVRDAQSQQPIEAQVRLELINPRPKGGYEYTTIQETTCDANGRWRWKNLPNGWYRVVATAEGFVPRVLDHQKINDQPGWREIDGELTPPGPVSGRVVDADGKPLADVKVRLDSVTALDDTRYESIEDYEAQTDAAGDFRIDSDPIGKSRLSLFKEDLVRPGLGQPIEMPAGDLKLTMSPAATLQVTVDFGNAAKPPQYLIQIEPEGGNKIGSWGGSSTVDDQNQVIFRNVPPGKYVLRGQPNPAAEREITAPIEVDLQGGEVKLIKLKAR
ncbi:MAG: collagen binding domain-containing protein [Pirellulales bacterium]